MYIQYSNCSDSELFRRRCREKGIVLITYYIPWTSNPFWNRVNSTSFPFGPGSQNNFDKFTFRSPRPPRPPPHPPPPPHTHTPLNLWNGIDSHLMYMWTTKPRINLRIHRVRKGYDKTNARRPKSRWTAMWENEPSDIYALRRHRSSCASAQSDQSFHCPHEETLHSWLSKMRPVKILIRLRKCAGWSESSLGGHIWKYIFWRCGLDDLRRCVRILSLLFDETHISCTDKRDAQTSLVI